MTTLQIVWFGLIAVLFIGYAVLDGFDLGVGCWHLCAKTDQERRRHLAAIGPFWDGNEVWLITAGGALFAAFPPVYATVFSTLYLPLIVLLVALIARGVSIEFAGREPAPRARRRWDIAFALGSMLIPLLLGVALGNILRGLPINANGDFTGTLLDLLHPFPLLVGLLNVALTAHHGALYLALRLPGPGAERARRWAKHAWLIAMPLAMFTLAAAILTVPGLLRNFQAHGGWLIVPAIAIVALNAAGHWRNRPGNAAFLASCLAIAGFLASAAVALFPTMVPALGNAAHSLTAANASSSPLTLRIMLMITLIGMPLVIGYTIWVYRVFRGPVRDVEHY